MADKESYLLINAIFWEFECEMTDKVRGEVLFINLSCLSSNLVFCRCVVDYAVIEVIMYTSWVGELASYMR